jgi:hypothetical protein
METQFGSLTEKLDAWRKKMQDDEEASKTTDFKANPEEGESEGEHREVSKEYATVETSKG